MALTLVKDERVKRVDTNQPVHHLVDKFSWFFRCWHRKKSRPFTRDGHTFRVCLRCGMRRDFDLDAWKSTGGYYYGRDLNEHRERPGRKGTKQ